MLPHAIIPFDPDRHSNFLYCEVRRAASKFPYAHPGSMVMPVARWLAEVVRRATVANPRGCLVAVDEQDADNLLAVLVSEPQTIVWAYTKYGVRRHGLWSGLCAAAGLDLSGRTDVTIWSYAASRIAAKGYNLVPATWEKE